MVASAAINFAEGNQGMREWLAAFRRCRTASLVKRLERAVADGELPDTTDAQALGDHFATILHGLSIQARDGVSKEAAAGDDSSGIECISTATGSALIVGVRGLGAQEPGCGQKASSL